MNEITVIVANSNGQLDYVTAPTDMAMSLMEVLKGSGYPIEARCGGMALCATCHIEVLSDTHLPEPHDEELAMLDTTPNYTEHSRLSCQLRINEAMNGMKLRILGEQ